MRTLSRLIILTSLAVLVPGCGGGGGGSSGPDSDSRVPISASNAELVAATVLGSVVAVFDFGGVIDTSPIAAGGPGINTVQRLKTMPLGASQSPIGPETFPCYVSGSVTISGDIADPTTLSAGDRITADFDVCDDGDGAVIDGVFDASVVSFTGDLDLINARLTMSVDAVNLSITSEGDEVRANGDFTFTIDTLSAPVVTLEVTCESLSVAASGTTVTLADFSAIQTQNATATPRPVSAEADGRLTSNTLGGSVDFSTPVRFDAYDDSYPYTGELLVVGRNESSVRLVALNDTNVRLDVDSDGNGAVDAVIDRLWDEIWSR